MEENQYAMTPDAKTINAVEFLVSYLKKRDIRLTLTEWVELLRSIGVEKEYLLALSTSAAAENILTMEEADPDKEKYTLPLLLNVFLQIKIADDRITQRESDVICYRFGFDDDYTHTLEETAQKFGITRERVRMMENKVLRNRLHQARRAKKIRDFYC